MDDQRRPRAQYSVHLGEQSVAVGHVANQVCRAVIIPTAFLTDRDVRLYHYLRQSVVDFDSIDTLRGRLGRAGFTDVHSSSFLGWQHGIVHTVDGIRT